MTIDAAEIARLRKRLENDTAEDDGSSYSVENRKVLAILDELEKTQERYACNTAILHARTQALREAENERDAARALLLRMRDECLVWPAYEPLRAAVDKLLGDA